MIEHPGAAWECEFCHTLHVFPRAPQNLTDGRQYCHVYYRLDGSHPILRFSFLHIKF